MDFISSGTFRSGAISLPDGEQFSLAGLRGSSTIYTAAGSDIRLDGGSDSEALIYDLTLGAKNALRFSGYQYFDLGAGDDVLDLSVRPANQANSYNLNVTASGGSGDDVLVGGAGARNALWGDDANSSSQNGGNDLIYGGDRADLIGGDGSQFDFGTGGKDVVHGRSGNDEIYGDAFSFFDTRGGDDELFGDAGDDLIYGDSVQLEGGRNYGGDDRIDGGSGDDQLWGDRSVAFGDATMQGGDDTFVFDTNAGKDVVHDFGFGTDKLDVSALFVDFDALTIAGNGTSEVTVGLGGSNQVIVDSYDGAGLTLTSSDFIFA